MTIASKCAEPLTNGTFIDLSPCCCTPGGHGQLADFLVR